MGLGWTVGVGVRVVMDHGWQRLNRTGDQPGHDECSPRRQRDQAHQTSTTCSRSGPTETWQTGTPLISAIRAR